MPSRNTAHERIRPREAEEFFREGQHFVKLIEIATMQDEIESDSRHGAT